MKKTLLLIMMSVFIIAGTASAKMGDMVKQVGDLKVRIEMNMEDHGKSGMDMSGEDMHHAKGANKLNIFISDSDSKPVKNAKIKLSYSMPPKGNMPPMKYTSRAKLNGEQYDAKVNFSMKGAWDVMIYIKRPEKPLSKVDFSVHVK